ncbi:MAG: potassium channel beta subunit family protein [Bacteroidia bacterium]|jgi:voltage-dependent potassium channel beta subunit
MEYRRLGKTGLPVSELSFGSWITFGNQINDGVSERLMDIAYEAGVNFFDNAEVYAAGASEVVMGEILHKKNWSRDSYIVSSKVFFGAGAKVPTQKGLHRKHIVEACNQALQRLQVEYLDLYFCHRPDKQTPIEETVWSMHQLILSGKILYWGTSEWSAQEIMEAHMVAQRYNLIGPVVEQPQYNMLVRDKVEVEYSQIYKTVGLGTTIWSPLASGYLTGKYLNQSPADARLNREELGWLSERLLQETHAEKVKNLMALASDLGVSMPQLGVAWCLKNPDVSTVILGATKPEQLQETLTAPSILPLLTADVMERIENILQNKPQHPQY